MEPRPSSLDGKVRRPGSLSLRARVLLLAGGWLLLIVGIAGLFLPGIQGVLALAVALALFSAGSQRAHDILRRIFQRWPRAWSKIESWRHRVHDWFEKKPDDR